MQKFITRHIYVFRGIFYCLYAAFLFVQIYLRYSLPFPDYSSVVRAAAVKTKAAADKAEKPDLKSKIKLNKRYRLEELCFTAGHGFTFNPVCETAPCYQPCYPEPVLSSTILFLSLRGPPVA
jgi:hypothetical protein